MPSPRLSPSHRVATGGRYTRGWPELARTRGWRLRPGEQGERHPTTPASTSGRASKSPLREDHLARALLVQLDRDREHMRRQRGARRVSHVSAAVTWRPPVMTTLTLFRSPAT